jgi:hypothetical protein
VCVCLWRHHGLAVVNNGVIPSHPGACVWHTVSPTQLQWHKTQVSLAPNFMKFMSTLCTLIPPPFATRLGAIPSAYTLTWWSLHNGRTQDIR